MHPWFVVLLQQTLCHNGPMPMGQKRRPPQPRVQKAVRCAAGKTERMLLSHRDKVSLTLRQGRRVGEPARRAVCTAREEAWPVRG